MSEQNEMPERIWADTYNAGEYGDEPFEAGYPYLRNDHGDDGVVVRRSFGVDEMHAAADRIAELEAALALSYADDLINNCETKLVDGISCLVSDQWPNGHIPQKLAWLIENGYAERHPEHHGVYRGVYRPNVQAAEEASKG